MLKYTMYKSLYCLQTHKMTHNLVWLEYGVVYDGVQKHI